MVHLLKILNYKVTDVSLKIVNIREKKLNNTTSWQSHTIENNRLRVSKTTKSKYVL